MEIPCSSFFANMKSSTVRVSNHLAALISNTMVGLMGELEENGSCPLRLASMSNRGKMFWAKNEKGTKLSAGSMKVPERQIDGRSTWSANWIPKLRRSYSPSGMLMKKSSMPPLLSRLTCLIFLNWMSSRLVKSATSLAPCMYSSNFLINRKPSWMMKMGFVGSLLGLLVGKFSFRTKLRPMLPSLSWLRRMSWARYWMISITVIFQTKSKESMEPSLLQGTYQRDFNPTVPIMVPITNISLKSVCLLS